MDIIDDEIRNDREAVSTGGMTEAVYFERCMKRAYTERNRLVAFLASIFSASVDWHKGGDEESASGGGIVYIETPAGQLSWHFLPKDDPLFMCLPDFKGQWDRHTTDEKYHRLERLGRELPYDFTDIEPSAPITETIEHGRAALAAPIGNDHGFYRHVDELLLHISSYPTVDARDWKKPDTVRAVELLVDLGLIARDKDNYSGLKITDAGRAKLKELGRRS